MHVDWCPNIKPPVINSQYLCSHLAVSPPLLFPGSWSNEQCRGHSCTGAPGLMGAHYLNSQSQHTTVGSSAFVPCHTWLDVSVDVWSEGEPFPASTVSKGDAKGGLPQIVWGMGDGGRWRMSQTRAHLKQMGKKKIQRKKKYNCVEDVCLLSLVEPRIHLHSIMRNMFPHTHACKMDD